MDAIPFWPTLWPALTAGLAATVAGGGLLLWLGYVLIDRRLDLRNRADHADEESNRARNLREASLRVAYGELLSHAGRLSTFADAIASDNVPYPPFDINGWILLTQAHTLATVKLETAEALIHVYNRIRSTNGQINEFAEVTTGPTAAITFATLAATADDEGNLAPLAAKVHEQYQNRRADLRRALADRMNDLRMHLDIAIDAIEAELGIEEPVASARRNYVHEDPVHDYTRDK